MKPKFAENIVVVVLFKKKYRWYCTDKSLWKMDYLRLYDDYYFRYLQRGKTELEFVKEVGSFGEFSSSRFRIRLLDRGTAKEFLKKIEGDEISAGELAYDFLHAESEIERKARIPALFVNFDKSEFYSQFPGDEEFLHYLPDGWRGATADFTHLIPPDDRYWVE